MNKQPLTPHEWRRQSIHSIFLILMGFILLIMAFSSCSTPRYGCKSTWEMSGYNPKQY
jgi:hypothetical protein